jgi:hypothetical protein
MDSYVEIILRPILSVRKNYFHISATTMVVSGNGLFHGVP